MNTLSKDKIPFTQIPNEIIVDTRVSHLAFRIYVYIASEPDGGRPYRNDIKKALGIKDDSTISKALKNLIEFGWIDRRKVTPHEAKEHGGVSGSYIYHIHTAARQQKEIEK